MSERIPEPINPKEAFDLRAGGWLTPTKKDWLEQQEVREGLNLSREEGQDSPEQCAENLELLGSMLWEFEQEFDVEELTAITQFTTREEREGSIRKSARAALKSASILLFHLEKQDAIPLEVRASFTAQYLALDVAIGTVRAGPDGGVFEVVTHEPPQARGW